VWLVIFGSKTYSNYDSIGCLCTQEIIWLSLHKLCSSWWCECK